ncbi:MAG TPA: methyltransferase domain-containing protein [Solirubrobacterales bacterium]|nr:methyltransferase domain-containing protein [Solirubrobacterales bacterium]
MNICTIIAKNYVAHARVLAESFRAANPGGRCSVLVVDGHEGFLDPAEEPFELVGIEEIGLPDVDRMVATYDVTELSTAVKPWLLRHLLERDGVDSVTYLDPDILVVDSLQPVAELAIEHGIVLTPHLTAPLPRDGLKPAEEDILIAGSYNLGFISVGVGAPATELIEWWSARLERECLIEPGRGLFVDQRWIDLVPGIWPNLKVLRDPAYNIAYWNLPTRSFERSGDVYLAGGVPLRFFHFSGFDPLHPEELSKHQNRIEVASNPALRQICGEYAQLLLEHGYEQARTWPYGWSSLPNGIVLDDVTRRLLREGERSGELHGSVFERGGAKRFLAYLTEVPPGSRVSRYGRAVHGSRADLREAFPDLDGHDAVRFESWLSQNSTQPELARPQDPEPPAPEGGRLGVNLAGYLGSELGVGEAARQLRAALAARELPAAAIELPVEEARLGETFGALDEENYPFDVNLICANADMLPVIAEAAPPRFFEGRRSAGLWFWEVERFPERWHGSFDYVDEVWTASEFVAEALRPVSPIPVETIRIPVAPGDPGEVDRAALSMPEGFCFLFVFDYRSVLRRKNPLGLVEAFARAFEPGSGASLLIKTVGSDARPHHAEELTRAAAAHPDVHLLDGLVSAEAKDAMIAGCDCYVSLHRSEGLGLTMAEAMYFGKPVIATGYSGNLDFMTPENSYLVDFELAEIGEGAEPYAATARWAEPDLDHAAAQMRAVFDDPDEAARRGARAAADIRSSHSPEAAGKLLEERLRAIQERGAPSAPPEPALPAAPGAEPAAGSAVAVVPSPLGPPASARASLQHLLGFPQPPARYGSGRLRRFLKRAYMRVLRPYASHQRRIDLGLRDAVLELSAELSTLQRRLELADEASAAELRQELASVDRRLRDLDGDARGACVALAEDLERTIARVRRLEPLEERLEERLGERLKELSEADEALAARTEQSLAILRDAEESVSRLARATETRPYMADDRFRPRRHPALGSVIGFAANSRNGSPDGYRGFEELFRGPEEMIRERQTVYLPLLSGGGPVLDAGCGRGEFLDLLAEAGIEARGVDLDPGMVARCREKGHEVEEGNLLDVLEATPPQSLGCVFSAQVIEHLEAEDLQRFLELGAERLRPGGLLIMETVNPHCPQAMNAFWVDPTHQQPLFPETMLALCQVTGFASANAFCPLGSGDWELDSRTAGEYAVVASVSEQKTATP